MDIDLQKSVHAWQECEKKIGKNGLNIIMDFTTHVVLFFINNQEKTIWECNDYAVLHLDLLIQNKTKQLRFYLLFILPK